MAMSRLLKVAVQFYLIVLVPATARQGQVEQLSKSRKKCLATTYKPLFRAMYKPIFRSPYCRRSIGPLPSCFSTIQNVFLRHGLAHDVEFLLGMVFAFGTAQ